MRITNLSSIRNAARRACKEHGCSIKDDNVEVIVTGFTGMINDQPVMNVTIFNDSHRWLYGDSNPIWMIEGTATSITVLK